MIFGLILGIHLFILIPLVLYYSRGVVRRDELFLTAGKLLQRK